MCNGNIENLEIENKESFIHYEDKVGICEKCKGKKIWQVRKSKGYWRYYNCDKNCEHKWYKGKIWDYCFECGTPLSEDMQEGKDWFDIKNNGESFPICKVCKEKSERGELN